MRRWLNKVSSQVVVGLLILIQITATVCNFDENFGGTEVCINGMNNLLASYFGENHTEWYGAIRKVFITNNRSTTLPADVFDK